MSGQTIFSQTGTIMEGPQIKSLVSREDITAIPPDTVTLSSIESKKELMLMFLACLFLLPAWSSNQYDRSGRSTGIAWIQYASVQQAKAAINQFDGALTKGETISIRFAPIPVPPRQAPVSRDSFGHWTKRGGAARPAQTGGDLLSRLAPAKGDKGGNTTSHTNPRGGRGGRGKGRGRSGGRPKPKNEGDLDNELDSFMKKDGAGDVEMS
nr:hypothetical protein L203_05597 [Cryptococcus depauperatus CBS 7841]